MKSTRVPRGPRRRQSKHSCSRCVMVLTRSVRPDTLRRLSELDDAPATRGRNPTAEIQTRDCPARGRPNRWKSCSPRGQIRMTDKTPEQIADELLAKAGIGKVHTPKANGAARHIPWQDHVFTAAQLRLRTFPSHLLCRARPAPGRPKHYRWPSRNREILARPRCLHCRRIRSILSR